MNKATEICKSIGILLLYILFTPILGDIMGLTLTPYIVTTLIYIAIFKKDYIDNLKKLDKKTILTGLICWIVCLALMYVTSSILEGVLKGLPQNQDLINESFQKNKLPIIISSVLFAPFLEETAFRLNFKKSINNKYIYIIVTSLLFGYLHVINETGLRILFIIPYAIMGAGFAIANTKTDNIYSSIIFHSLHNAITVALLFFK